LPSKATLAAVPVAGAPLPVDASVVTVPPAMPGAGSVISKLLLMPVPLRKSEVA